MNTRTAQSLATAQAILGALAVNIQSDLDNAVGSEAKLAMAHMLQAECGVAATALSVQILGARVVLRDTAFVLESEQRDAAMARVVAMLNEGTLKLSDLTARMTVAAAPAVAPAAPAAPAAPVAPEVVAVAAPLAHDAVEAAPAALVVAPHSATSEVAPNEAQTEAGADAAPKAKRTLTRTPIPAHVNEAAIALRSPKIRQSLRDSLRSELRPGSKPIAYRDPSTGIGWTGVGKPPAWLSELLIDGMALDDFRVEATGAAPDATASAPVAQTEVAAPAATEPAADIGTETCMEFDATGFEGGEPTGSEDDIGDVLTGLQSVGSDRPAGNVSSFMAVA